MFLNICVQLRDADTSQCSLCWPLLQHRGVSFSVSSLLLLCLVCSESFVDWCRLLIFSYGFRSEEFHPRGLRLCPGEESGLGYGSVAADPKSRLGGNQITLSYFMRAGLSLLSVFWSLFPCPALLGSSPSRSASSRAVPGRARSAGLRSEPSLPSLPPFYALPRGFPYSSALQTARGECGFPICLLTCFLIFSPSFYSFFFLSVSCPHDATFTDFWWVTGSTRNLPDDDDDDDFIVHLICNLLQKCL